MGHEYGDEPGRGVALLVLGLALLLLAWRESMRQDGEPPLWSPMPAIVGCLTLTVILSVGLRERESSYVRQKTEATSKALATEISVQLNHQANSLERLARRRADSAENTAAGWAADVRDQFAASDDYGCVTIAYVAATLRTMWCYPTEGNEGMARFYHATMEARRSIRSFRARSR